ncbi:MAG: serine/threonine-protein kinase [Acidobacteriota bacterium]|nr:serine/threonine-protein kinase [Acidobacteriota bacterium]
MTDSTAWQDLDAALEREYIVVREQPQSAGISAFSAQSRTNGSEVGIKTVPAGIFAGTTAVSDADVAARRVQHPNIVSILGTGLQGDTFYWISPAIDARTLRVRLSRGGRMDVQDSLTVLRDVSAALTHAHLHGVVHGGLSPDSVVISGGSALVTDLGIPEVFAALRQQGVRASHATPSAAEPLRYASPEQGSGGRADTRSDVYAWGVIAYELLGGRHPFAGRSTPRQMMAAHADEEPPPLATGPSGAPSTVTRLVMRCLSKDPAKRPESAREILEVMTREMLVPPKAAPAGSGQKLVIALLIISVASIGLIAWLGMRS